MKTSEELKHLVKTKYSEIAAQDPTQNQASCCGAGSVSQEVYNIMTDDYSALEGYQPEADLGLGCGLPTAFAQIKAGDTVIDLGSGAGNDCFVARHETGPTGKVLGIDFSEAMIARARQNAETLGYNNVEFRFGDIDEMPVSDGYADVVVSNCVLNLVPEKPKVMAEVFRVLKPGGHFSISDIVLVGELPAALQEAAEMYAGCVAGAIQKDTYLAHLADLGFEDLTLQKEKPISIPADILSQYLDPAGIAAFQKGKTGIFSITVFGRKPGGSAEVQPVSSAEASADCRPGSGCC